MLKKILVIGKGAREHALIHAFKRSASVGKIYAAPGNGGTADMAENIEIDLDPPFSNLISFIREKEIDLAVVGPEEYLVLGMVDCLEASGIKVFGPTQEAAMLEGSKIFAKEIMKKAGAPTAPYAVVSSREEAEAFIGDRPLPLVFKADALAAGKGVFVCETKKELDEALDVFFVERRFGASKVFIETFLKGFEASLLAFCDGDNVKSFPFCQDHKRIYDGDLGPNTGGMGVYLPLKNVNEKHLKKAEETIIKPILKQMKKEKHPYKGILYVGLMIDGEDLSVVEFNCRFGDPEAQCLLPLLESDLYEICLSCIEGRLDGCDFNLKDESSCVVVVASKGYPGEYRKGIEIILDDKAQGTFVYHAGTKKKDGKLFSDGGRVLCFSSQSKTLKAAVDLAYLGVRSLKMEEAYFRTDIGKKGL